MRLPFRIWRFKMPNLSDAISRVYYTKPSITEREIGYATDAATNGWGEHCYEYVGTPSRHLLTRVRRDALLSAHDPRVPAAAAGPAQ